LDNYLSNNANLHRFKASNDKCLLGTVLTDVRQRQWVVGRPVGAGGFGAIYQGSPQYLLFNPTEINYR
jgi:hypothetical protein